MTPATLRERAAVAVLVTLAILPFVATIANWVAIDQAVHAALQHNPPQEHYFIETYGSGLHNMLMIGVGFQILVAITVLIPGIGFATGHHSRKSDAIILPWSTICCGFGALTMGPGSGGWGEPDGQSLTEDYFPTWHWPLLCTLATLIILCCVTTTILAATTRTRERR